MRVHSLVDIYRQLNEQSTEFTFKDKIGKNQQSRLNFFLTDTETAAHTNSALIYPITDPFDQREITLAIDFDKVMRGKGNWNTKQLSPKKQRIPNYDKEPTGPNSIQVPKRNNKPHLTQ